MGGTLIGGFAKPADQYEGTFDHIKFFRDWPYALPTLIIGSLGLITALMVIFFVRETLNVKSTKLETTSTWELLKLPGVPVVLFVKTMSSILGTVYPVGKCPPA